MSGVLHSRCGLDAAGSWPYVLVDINAGVSLNRLQLLNCILELLTSETTSLWRLIMLKSVDQSE